MTMVHIDPLGRTTPILDTIDEVFGDYAHGPKIGWVLLSSLHIPEEPKP